MKYDAKKSMCVIVSVVTCTLFELFILYKFVYQINH